MNYPDLREVLRECRPHVRASLPPEPHMDPEADGKLRGLVARIDIILSAPPTENEVLEDSWWKQVGRIQKLEAMLDEVREFVIAGQQDGSYDLSMKITALVPFPNAEDQATYLAHKESGT